MDTAPASRVGWEGLDIEQPDYPTKPAGRRKKSRGILCDLVCRAFALEKGAVKIPRVSWD